MPDRPSESPYRTPTRPVDVEMAIEGGRAKPVTLYLSTQSETRVGPETMDEFLNRVRDFLPVRARESERTFLVRRSAIRTVTVAADQPDVVSPEESLTSVDLVRLELDGGEILEGTLTTVLPPDRPRLSDFFNFDQSTFIPIGVGEGVTYVNRNFISIVWL